jgi:hypothetical protein
MNLKEEIKGWVGSKVNGIGFIVDIADFCPLKCPSCAVGSIGPRKGGYMSFNLFRNILDKAQSECKVRRVQLYGYCDPCTHPDLHLFVQECRDRGIQSMISTMLQTTKCDFAKVIEARPSEFRISFPGWNKMEYYQRGAKPDRFNKKIEEVCVLPRYPETRWTLLFQLYNDNGDELGRAKELAKRLNLDFVVLPAIFMPCEKMVEGYYSEQDKELISHLLETPQENLKRLRFDDDYCLLWKQITLDAKADVYLCQLIYEDRFIIGNFMDTSLKKLQKTMRKHPFCKPCMKMGAHAYQFLYGDACKYKNMVGVANKKRFKKEELSKLDYFQLGGENG